MKSKTNKAFGFRTILPYLLFLLGGLLRFLYLGSMPAGMHQDESFVAWNAYAIFHEHMDSAGHLWPVYMADWGDGHSALYVWLTLPFVALGGGHVSALLARLPQAIMATLTLPAVYGIVRRTIDEKAALWSMFLLAICPWHIMMSRWGLDANLAPAFLMFGLYLFLRALEASEAEKSKKQATGFWLLTAFLYGLSLYAYAVIWPIVPVLLLLQTAYAVYHKKLRFRPVYLAAVGLLFIMALPLLLFLLVNAQVIPEIRLPFMTIPSMSGYRGGEVAFTPERMYRNLRTALSLLWHQNTGAPYDILLPWGLFYDIGRVFLVIGACCLSFRTVQGLIRREYRPESFLFIQLVGGGLECLLVTAVLHQINALYIPLVLCEAYGVYCCLLLVRRYHIRIAQAAGGLVAAVYLVCLILFQRDYYTDYKEIADAYFGAGLKECVAYAQEMCSANDLHTITVEKGAQWPRLLLYLETLPSEYLRSVVYDEPPAPASFRSGDLLIRTRIDNDQLDPQSVYILYYIDTERFQADYTLVQFCDWYVAVPRM